MSISLIATRTELWMKFAAATVFGALATEAAAAAGQERASVAPKNMQAIAPALADYTDEVLFGDVWLRPQLVPRDRSLVTVSVLIATGKTAQLKGHLNRALDNGLLPTEIAGVVTHLAFYTGWPNAVSALNVIDEVFAERKIPSASLRSQPKEVKATKDEPGARSNADPDLLSLAPKLVQLSNEVIMQDLWRTPDLRLRDRSLVTIAVLAANGDDDELALHVRRGVENGLTTVEIGEALTHLAFYAGLPKATAAASIASNVLGDERTAANNQDVANRMIIAGANAEVRAAPAKNFTGPVFIASPFEGKGESLLRGATVTFEIGSRTNWHVHPNGQLLVVTEGEGWVQAEGEPVRAIKKGDVIWTAPGVKHWHGATPARAMSHVALEAAVEGKVVTWLEPVTAEQYRQR